GDAGLSAGVDGGSGLSVGVDGDAGLSVGVDGSIDAGVDGDAGLSVGVDGDAGLSAGVDGDAGLSVGAGVTVDTGLGLSVGVGAGIGGSASLGVSVGIGAGIGGTAGLSASGDIGAGVGGSAGLSTSGGVSADIGGSTADGRLHNVLAGVVLSSFRLTGERTHSDTYMEKAKATRIFQSLPTFWFQMRERRMPFTLRVNVTYKHQDGAKCCVKVFGYPLGIMEEYDRDAPLFDRRFHVLVQYADRDEKLLPLTIRLLTGVRQNSTTNQKERVIRVEITDDDGVDPYFLYLWSVSEEEFHELKAQQRLLVDFATFPANLIELLQCCLKDSKKLAEEEEEGEKTTEQEDREREAKSAVSEAPHTQKARSAGPVPLSYLAVLNTSDTNGRSVFNIVETNPFKQLTHLSLYFVPGNDAAIKAYLAARLAQVGANRRSLSSSLKQTSEVFRNAQESEAKLQQQLSALGYETESTLSQEKMKFADELNAQRKDAARALKEREDELNAKIEALVGRYEEELQALRTTADANEALVQDLTKQKYQHEMQIDHLRVQSKDLGQGKTALTEEVDELRTQNKQLDQKVFQQEKQINALQVRADALQQQLADKEEVIKKTTDLLESAKLHNEEVDESLKMYRDNHARLQQKLELSISEINKVGIPLDATGNVRFSIRRC
ncbi:hypothetical protein BBJ28_00025342, partial [Nothophytophthora sp. Chile5]